MVHGFICAHAHRLIHSWTVHRRAGLGDAVQRELRVQALSACYDGGLPAWRCSTHLAACTLKMELVMPGSLGCAVQATFGAGAVRRKFIDCLVDDMLTTGRAHARGSLQR